MGRVNKVIHGGVGNELMLIHYNGVGRVDELHIIIKQQGEGCALGKGVKGLRHGIAIR